MEEIEKLEAKLSLLESADKVDRIEAVDAMNDLAWQLRNKEKSRSLELARQALESSLKIPPYPYGHAYSLCIKANVGKDTDPAEALVSADNALRLNESIQNEELSFKIHNTLAVIYVYLSEYTSAFEHQLRAVENADAIGDVVLRITALINVGMIYSYSGDVKQGIENMLEVLELSTKHEYYEGQCFAALNLATLYHQDGQIEKVQRFIDQATDLLSGTDYHDLRLECLQLIAVVSYDAEDYQRALESYRLVLEDSHLSNPVVTCQAMVGSCKSLIKLDDCTRALEAVLDAKELSERTSNIEGQIECATLHSEILEAQGDFQEALLLRKELEELSKKQHQANEDRQLSNFKIIYKTERIKKQAEVAEHAAQIHRVKNVELAQMLEELKIAKQQAEEARQSAEVANHSKSQFLANMSHEIRTPMNAVLGFSEVLRTLVKGDRERTYLDSIQSSGKALLGLINDILDLSKVEAGKLDLEYAAVDVPAVFQDMKAVFGQRMDEKGLTFLLDLDPNLARSLTLDEVRLRQVLVNLIGNAIKFTKEGHIRVTVAAVPEKGTASRIDLEIVVEDTGIGIPEDQREKIFGAFEQTAGQSYTRFGGTGLGLAITRRLVEMMDGEIRVEGEVGEGSTFHVLLKDVAIASVDDLAGTDGGFDPDSVRFDPASVLVVDDVEANRQLVSAFLTPYGLAVMEAADGQEGVEQTRAHRPDLVLMDIRMSGMNGLDATCVLKADAETADVPVVALTASVMREDEAEIQETFDGFLRKPVSRAALIAEMARFLPHQMVGPIGPESASPAAEETQPADLDEESRGKLSDLVDLLESNVRPVWEGLRGSANVTAIEEFAEMLGRLEHGTLFAPVQAWTEKLCGQADAFQMNLVQQTLEEFPDLVKELKQSIQAITTEGKLKE